LIVPVIRARLRVRIFNLIGRRSRDVSVTVAVVHSVGVTEHDVIRAGATHNGLVHIVAEGVVVGEELHVRSVATLNVIDSESSRTFARRLVREGIRLRISIAARSDGDFGPGEQVGQATAGVVCRGGQCGAIFLLPHLIEAMHRTGGVCIVLHARRQPKDTAGKVIHVLDARVGYAVREAGPQ
jgi:hypothetical protein